METDLLTCLVCCASIRQKPSAASNSTFENFFKVFCKYMEIEGCEKTKFDFQEEPFPFCDLCKVELAGVVKLDELVSSLQQQIRSQILSLTAKLLESPRLDDELPSKVYERKGQKVSFRRSIKSVRKGKRTEMVEVQVRHLGEVDPTRTKVMNIRKKIRKRYDVRVRLDRVMVKCQLPRRKKLSSVDLVPKEKEEVEVASDTSSTGDAADDGEEYNDEGVPADLDFTDVPMDDMLFDQVELDSALDNGKTASPARIDDNEDLIVGMEIEVDTGTEVPEEVEVKPSSPLQSCEDDKVDQEVAQEVIIADASKPEDIPDLPEQVPITEIDNAKYMPTQVYPITEKSPGVFFFGDFFSFRHDETNDCFACQHCNFQCSRRTRILQHMRFDHVRTSENPLNQDGKVNLDKQLTTKFVPLTFGRTLELRPGKFVYDDKYAFEKRGDAYWCETCGISSPDKARMVRHIRYTHKFAGRFKCEVCEEVFAVGNKLKAHMEKHSETPLHVCEECGKPCQTTKIFKAHQLTHRKNREPSKYVCDQCGKTSISITALKAHLSRHDRCFECPVCEEKFSDKNKFTVHRATHRKGRRQKCEQCDAEFTTVKHLREHVNYIHYKSESVETCVDTEENASSSSSTIRNPTTDSLTLENESAVQSISKENATPGTEDQTAELPNENGSSLPPRSDEAQTADNDNDSTYVPEGGGKTLRNKRTPKGYPCPKCEKVLKIKRYLVEHMRIHEGGPAEFRCKVCGKECRKKSNIRCHIAHRHGKQYLTRNDEYVEDLRPESERQVIKSAKNACYNRHLPVEYNEDGTPKGIQCSQCNVVVRNKHNLKRHVDWVHLGIGRATCEFCGKVFPKFSNYRIHLKNTHGKATSEVDGWIASAEHVKKKFAEAKEAKVKVSQTKQKRVDNKSESSSTVDDDEKIAGGNDVSEKP